jgi:hypothetical protein
MDKPLLRRSVVGACILLSCLPGGTSLAHEAPPPPPAPSTRPGDDALRAASAEMAAAATNLWAALTPEQQKAAGFEFGDAERLNFHFVPRERKGLPWAQMTMTQRLLAQALLSSGLSSRTYGEAMTIMSLEEILAGIEKGKGPKRDPELYFFTIFGKPGPTGTWGWRVEGHHVALNFTIVDGRGVASAPAFLGANPHEVREGPRAGLRTLAAEDDMGRALAKSLDDVQRKAGVLSDAAPKDIVTGNKRDAASLIGEPKGVRYAELKPEQQAMLRVLVNVYAHRMRPELAHADLAAIEQSGWADVRFGWAGGMDKGQGHYYRIHGPTFLVEFDNTQGGANHVHSVWRDLKNDFGEDLLKRHYERDHAAGGK